MVGVLDDMWCGHTNAHGDMHGERPAKHSLRRIDEARRLTALSQFRRLRQRRVFVLWYARPGELGLANRAMRLRGAPEMADSLCCTPHTPNGAHGV